MHHPKMMQTARGVLTLSLFILWSKSSWRPYNLNRQFLLSEWGLTLGAANLQKMFHVDGLVCEIKRT